MNTEILQMLVVAIHVLFLSGRSRCFKTSRYFSIKSKYFLCSVLVSLLVCGCGAQLLPSYGEDLVPGYSESLDTYTQVLYCTVLYIPYCTVL